MAPGQIATPQRCVPGRSLGTQIGLGRARQNERDLVMVKDPLIDFELWSYGAFYSITTFIRAITSLLQIRQVAHLRSTTCNLQGLSPTQRSTQTTPSRDLTLGVMQLATVRSPEREPQKTIIPEPQKVDQGRQWKGGPRWRFCHDVLGPLNPKAADAPARCPVARFCTDTSTHAAQACSS